jgi:hypothetical protein
LDSILASTRLLDSRSWLFFKLYKNPELPTDWANSLNWYHQTLISVVNPVVTSNVDIDCVFFGLYGPEPYGDEDESYVKALEQTAGNLVYIRLRLAVKKGKKNAIKNALLTSIAQNGALIWNYELMSTFNVMSGLGSRYGNNLPSQTLQYIRFWDAGCRYILSILRMPGNWEQTVDVWGIPHLINNSLGAWLRLNGSPVVCPNGHGDMYMSTVVWDVTLNPPIQTTKLPLFVFSCPRCGRISTVASNI